MECIMVNTLALVQIIGCIRKDRGHYVSQRCFLTVNPFHFPGLVSTDTVGYKEQLSVFEPGFILSFNRLGNGLGPVRCQAIIWTNAVGDYSM